MNPWIATLAACLLLTGLAPATDIPESKVDTELREATVRRIFRLVVGQPELKDAQIGVSADADRIWTCVWTREGDREVVVLQVRDSDGAYRRPNIVDLSSLKFGMRLDLKERIAGLIREQDESKAGGAADAGP